MPECLGALEVVGVLGEDDAAVALLDHVAGLVQGDAVHELEEVGLREHVALDLVGLAPQQHPHLLRPPIQEVDELQLVVIELSLQALFPLALEEPREGFKVDVRAEVVGRHRAVLAEAALPPRVLDEAAPQVVELLDFEGGHREQHSSRFEGLADGLDCPVQVVHAVQSEEHDHCVVLLHLREVLLEVFLEELQLGGVGVAGLGHVDCLLTDVVAHQFLYLDLAGLQFAEEVEGGFSGAAAEVEDGKGARMEGEMRESQQSKDGSDFQLNSTITSLQAQLREKQRNKEQQLNELKMKIYMLESLAQELERKSADAGQLHRQVVTTLEGQLEELKQRKDQELNQLSSTIYSLEFELRQYQQKDQNSSELTGKIRHLELQIQQSTREKGTEIAQLNIIVRAVRNQLRETEYNLTQSAEHFRRVQTELAQALRPREEERRRFQEIIRQLEEQINEQPSRQDASERDLHQMREHIARLEHDLRYLEEQLGLRDTQIIQLNQHLTLSTKKVARFSAQIISCKRQVSEYQTSLAQMEGSLAQKQVDLREMEGKLTGIQDANQSLQHRSQYAIQFVRSILISIETLIEGQQLDFAVSQTVSKEVASGLEECEIWNRD